MPNRRRHTRGAPRLPVLAALAVAATAAAAAPPLSHDRDGWEQVYLHVATRSPPLTEAQSEALYARGLRRTGGRPDFRFEAPAAPVGDHPAVTERSYLRLAVDDRFVVQGRYFNPGERYFCVHDERRVASEQGIDLSTGTSVCYPER